MDARVIVVCLCVVAIVHGEQAPIGLCRANERLLMCGCPRTCREPAPDCAAVCRPGCFCEDGQVRNDKGLCVNLSECPPILLAYKQDTSEPRPNGGKCPENEEYRYCEPCNRTCEKPNPICPAQCNRGCFCKKGLLRDEDRSCVTPDKCSKSPNATQHLAENMTCGEHQVYKQCETMEKTCSEPEPWFPTPCVKGCFCEDGYVKSPNGQCIKLEECPIAQGSGTATPAQEKIDLTTPANGNTSLATPIQATTGLPTPAQGRPDLSTPAQGRSGLATPAQANTGLAFPSHVNIHLLIDPMFQDTQPSHHDPAVEDCAPDEEYFSCGWCEPSCSEPSPNCPNKVCIRGCLCRPPLLRHHSGSCVEAKECYPEKCNDPNEEYVCLFGCELRCDKHCVRPRFCVLGCYCRIGLLRDSSGLCVVKEKCSNTTEVHSTAVVAV